MTYDEYNDFCRSLPATTYVMQWSGAHVWKVGGKVFAIGGWEKANQPAFTFKVSALNFDILKDEPGFRPAPYLASRGFKWLQKHEEPDIDDDELKQYLIDSHQLVSLGLTQKNKKSSASIKPFRLNSEIANTDKERDDHE